MFQVALNPHYVLDTGAIVATDEEFALINNQSHVHPSRHTSNYTEINTSVDEIFFYP